MNKFISRWLTNALSIYIIAYLFSGVHIRDFMTAMGAALILGILNMLVRPVLIVLTLPINIMTLGIFTFILNGFLLKLVDAFMEGFVVDNFMTAVFASIALTFVNMLITKIAKPDR